MTNEEREIFYKTLDTLENINSDADYQKLLPTIKPTPYLYRYRDLSTNNIKALKANFLYASSPDQYSDWADTRIMVENWFLEEQTSKPIQGENLENALKLQPNLKTGYPDEATWNTKVNEILNSSPAEIRTLLEPFIIELTLAIRHNLYSICFTEDANSDLMWANYANQHTGFLLEYAFQDLFPFSCSESQICTDCLQRQQINIFPVYYSDTKHYHNKIFTTFLQKNAHDMIMLAWELESLSLIKKESYSLEKEWRMLFRACRQRPKITNLVPHSVSLGKNMENEDKEKIIACAKQAGIKKIYQTIMNNKKQLEKRLIYLQEQNNA